MELTIEQKKELNEKFKVWFNKFKNAKKEEMSKELSTLFMTLVVMENQNRTIDDKEIIPVLKFSYEVTKKRAEFINLQINQPAIFLISFLSHGIPGKIIMYLYFLKGYQMKYGHNIITISQLTNIFPMGFITDDELDNLWDEQKWNGINMLDIIDPQIEN